MEKIVLSDQENHPDILQTFSSYEVDRSVEKQN